MVKITVNAGLAVEAGPNLNLNTVITPDSYTVGRVELGPSGSAEASGELPLLPDGGEVILLAVKASSGDGTPAEITVTPRNGATDGDGLTVQGTLFIGHRGVLAALVTDGPRTLGLENTGPDSVTVDVLAALDS